MMFYRLPPHANLCRPDRAIEARVLNDNEPIPPPLVIRQEPNVMLYAALSTVLVVLLYVGVFAIGVLNGYYNR